MHIVNPMTAIDVGKVPQGGLVLLQSPERANFSSLGVVLSPSQNGFARVLILRGDKPQAPSVAYLATSVSCLALETEWVLELVPFPLVPSPEGEVGSITAFDSVPHMHINDGPSSSFASTALLDLHSLKAGNLTGYTSRGPVPGWRMWMRAEEIGSANAKPLVDSSDLPRPDK